MRVGGKIMSFSEYCATQDGSGFIIEKEHRKRRCFSYVTSDTRGIKTVRWWMENTDSDPYF